MFRKIMPVGFLLITISITGCVSTTPSSMQTNGSDASYASDKNAKSVAECIVGKWEDAKVIGSGPIANNRPTSTGYRVTLHFGDRLQYMADIDSAANGSKTKFYVSKVSSFGKDPRNIEVESCQ